jgi:hypothetical protein
MAAIYDDHPCYQVSGIPFQDHAFTIFLKSILVGYVKIGFLVTASQGPLDVPDSIGSLKYGAICALN